MTDAEVLTIYSAPNCMGCKMTARALQKAGVKFKLVDLTTLSPEAIEAFKAEGLMQAPIVRTGEGDQWSGFRPDKIKQTVETMPAEQVDEALAKIYEERFGKPMDKPNPKQETPQRDRPESKANKLHR